MQVTVNRKEVVQKCIFHQGNIVVLKSDPTIIVLVTSHIGEDHDNFSGVALTKTSEGVGEYSRNWDENQFEQFHGDITFSLE